MKSNRKTQHHWALVHTVSSHTVNLCIDRLRLDAKRCP
jgi:hypothetical protein